MSFKLTKRSTCRICKEPVVYSPRYDAFYCENCNLWLEGPCSHGECSQCDNRPTLPRKVEGDYAR